MLDIFASAGYHQYAIGARLYCQFMKELETLPAYQDTLESFAAPAMNGSVLGVTSALSRP